MAIVYAILIVKDKREFKSISSPGLRDQVRENLIAMGFPELAVE